MFTGSRFSLEEARELQLLLSKTVIIGDRLPDPIKYVGGVDVAYTNRHSIGAVTVFDYHYMELIEKKTSRRPTRFPYIPSFLAFREIPAAHPAIKKLQAKPDVFLVDGHGLAHPNRLGFASHLGVVLDAPTIGVAKSLLCGEVRNQGVEPWKPIIYEGEVVGGAVFTLLGSKPVYVSVGHKTSLETAVKIVLHCTKGHRIPEPLRVAHMTAEKEARYRRK